MVALMDEDVNAAETKQLGELVVKAKPISCHLIEVDHLGNVLWSWSYPTCDNDGKRVCLKRFNGIRRTTSSQEEAFKFFRFRSSWYYIFISSSLSSYDNKAGKLDKLDQVGVIVEAEEFNPERYRTITEVLFHTYFKQENPTVVLQQFLSLVVSGTCQLPKRKIYNTSDHDVCFPLSRGQIYAIITKFGLETIVLMTSLIRRQRIVVYHHDVDELIKYSLNIPAFGPDLITIWKSVYPWVGYNDEELSSFSESEFHILGCPNASIENRTDLFDVFVNIPAGEISVSPHAKEKMMMGKPHKEMALFLLQLAETNDSETNECDIIHEIQTKIKELAIDSDKLNKMPSVISSGTKS